ncbi:MAG: hypothetical protein J5562_08900 [Clostridia bacterium]|nr:hypothetical protein [Clostridia bacterium]
MGIYVNISGLEGENTVTTFRLLVSEEMLAGSEDEIKESENIQSESK